MLRDRHQLHVGETEAFDVRGQPRSELPVFRGYPELGTADLIPHARIFDVDAQLAGDAQVGIPVAEAGGGRVTPADGHFGTAGRSARDGGGVPALDRFRSRGRDLPRHGRRTVDAAEDAGGFATGIGGADERRGFLGRKLIVAVDREFGAQLAQILHKIVGE